MMDILKNLAPKELATVLMVLGIIRETRLILKDILKYRIEKSKLDSRKES